MLRKQRWVGHQRCLWYFGFVQSADVQTFRDCLCLCLYCHINILLTELSRSVWENLVEYRTHCVRSVLTTSVTILPYRPPLRLIKSNKYIFTHRIQVGRKRKVLTKTTKKKSKQIK